MEISTPLPHMQWLAYKDILRCMRLSSVEANEPRANTSHQRSVIGTSSWLSRNDSTRALCILDWSDPLLNFAATLQQQHHHHEQHLLHQTNRAQQMTAETNVWYAELGQRRSCCREAVLTGQLEETLRASAEEPLLETTSWLHSLHSLENLRP